MSEVGEPQETVTLEGWKRYKRMKDNHMVSKARSYRNRWKANDELVVTWVWDVRNWGFDTRNSGTNSIKWGRL